MIFKIIYGRRPKTEADKLLNRFLVEIFNEILKTEEKCLAESEYKNISIKELHLLEAVRCGAENNKNTAADIADALRITPGSLTTAVKGLIKKGYLLRETDTADRRIVRLSLTEEGENAEKLHAEFHSEMVREVIANLSEEELMVFMKGLSGVTAFFRKKYNKKQNAHRRNIE